MVYNFFLIKFHFLTLKNEIILWNHKYQQFDLMNSTNKFIKSIHSLSFSFFSSLFSIALVSEYCFVFIRLPPKLKPDEQTRRLSAPHFVPLSFNFSALDALRWLLLASLWFSSSYHSPISLLDCHLLLLCFKPLALNIERHHCISIQSLFVNK